MSALRLRKGECKEFPTRCEQQVLPLIQLVGYRSVKHVLVQVNVPNRSTGQRIEGQRIAGSIPTKKKPTRSG